MRFDRKTISALVAEFICTFIFILTLCGASLSEKLSDAKLGSVGAGISTAFVAVGIIYAFGPYSGAHFNPAVTAGAIVAGKIDPILGALYIVLQLLAGIAAVAAWSGFYPASKVAEYWVLSPPSQSNVLGALGMEFLLTFILVIVIFNTAMAPRLRPAKGDIESSGDDISLIERNHQRMNFAPIAIGLTLGFLCFLGGPISGGAFNPARATAPAVLTRDFSNLWIYWVGDLAGGVAAALLGRFVFAQS